ncbi:hypothetical protein ACA910_006886 [Epithemia clementina (nom. ined.)]
MLGLPRGWSCWSIRIPLRVVLVVVLIVLVTPLRKVDAFQPQLLRNTPPHHLQQRRPLYQQQKHQHHPPLFWSRRTREATTTSPRTRTRPNNNQWWKTLFVSSLHAKVQPEDDSDEGPSSSTTSTIPPSKKQVPPNEADVIVVGSGLAGLSCAALLSQCYGKHVVVLESHDIAGGAAHSWTRRCGTKQQPQQQEEGVFHFESGPSLYSGLSTPTSPNPLKGIFQMLQSKGGVVEEPEWITYDRWGTVLPNGSKFAAQIGPEEFQDVLLQHGGPEAVEQFARIMERMKPLSEAAQSLTSLALREDAGAILTTLFKYPRALLQTLRYGPALSQPFSTILEELNITNDFVKNWLDMLCLLLQGLPASGTMNAVIAYMLADWYRPGVTLDFPKGGSGAIVQALVRAVQESSSSNNNKKSGVFCNCHVGEILVSPDGQRATGVKLAKTGQIITTKEAIVSNADPYITWKLLQPSVSYLKPDMVQYMQQWVNTDTSTGGVEDLPSFVHLHAGIDATGLPTTPSADFPAQWAVIRDWTVGVEAPRNIVLCSMPSLIDPDMAPPNCHVLHAYVPATEPYAKWAGLNRGSTEYKQLKEEAADFLWSAIEEYVPNARDRAIAGTVQIGTPLTHERFLRRTRGTYGPRFVVGGNKDKATSLPGHATPLSQLYMVGDFTFPGIGVPATAASGAIAAHSLVPVWEHWQMLDEVKLPQQS